MQEEQEVLTQQWLDISQQTSFNAQYKYIIVFGSPESGKKTIRYLATGKNHQSSIFDDRNNNNYTSFLCSVKIKQNESQGKFYAVQIFEAQSQTNQYTQILQKSIQIVLVCKSDKQDSIDYVFKKLNQLKQHQLKIPKALDFLIIRTFQQQNQITWKWEDTFKKIQKNIKQFCPNNFVHCATLSNLKKKCQTLNQQNINQTQVLFLKMIAFRFKSNDKEEKIAKFKESILKKLEQEYFLQNQNNQNEEFDIEKVQGVINKSIIMEESIIQEQNKGSNKKEKKNCQLKWESKSAQQMITAQSLDKKRINPNQNKEQHQGIIQKCNNCLIQRIFGNRTKDSD